MAQSQRWSAQGNGPAPEKQGKHKLDELDATRVAKHLLMFQPTESVLENLMVEARLSIPGLAETAEVQRVLDYNPICVLAVARKSRFSPADPVAEGFIALLPLNSLGLQMLALGTFNANSPDLRLIAAPDERPAGIYMWGVFAPGPLAGGLALFMEKMSSPQYAGVNIYSRPNTDVGIRFNEVLGLTKGVQVGPIAAPHLWVFPRTTQPPLYDSYVPNSGKNELGITVARTFEDLSRVIAIRSAVYIGNRNVPMTRNMTAMI